MVKRLLRPAKTGHAGTLDPLASGVLVVCVGPATRLIDYVQRMPKRYRATFLLGRTSPTEDIEGEVKMLANAPQPSRDEIASAAARLTGEIRQRPPAYSALKVAGRRAYDLARAGHEIELAPRTIIVHSIDTIDYAYPQLTLDIRCGSGTYVRSLGRDLAESLGTGAVMSALERSEVGHFHIADAWPFDRLTASNVSEWLGPPLDAARSAHHDSHRRSDGRHRARSLRRAGNGKCCKSNGIGGNRADGALVAILCRRSDGQFGPRINLTAAN